MISPRINIMEVCGTHTMAIARYGLRKLFPPEITMLSGPGCPVCVTSIEDIDRAIEISKRKDVITATFGDMMRVPGSRSSLESEKARGSDIRIVYSPMDALEVALFHPEKKVVFLGVGFETTSPAVAGTVRRAKNRRITNFYVLPMFKTIPRALEAVLRMGGQKVDGFLLPGHVSAIIGPEPYGFIPEKFGVPCVIGGFSANDIMTSINMLGNQIKNRRPLVEIQYAAVVKRGGNKKAQDILREVFEESDAVWRGIGKIPGSGLKLGKECRLFDASRLLNAKRIPSREPAGCSCGLILIGLKKPAQCRLFGSKCTPAHPVGPCMVSSEGACAAEYKYGNVGCARIVS